MFKYADAAYIVIPAARSGVNWNWIVQTGGRKTTIWDLTGPNRLKWYSQTATASLLKVCLHRYRTFDALPPSRCLASPWRVISRSASTSATLSASARSHCTPWNCCVTTAWATTCWGTSTRPSSSPSCCMHHRHGRVLPATSRSICTTCYSARLVHGRRSHAVSTGCWHGRQPLHEHTAQSSPCFAQMSPGQKRSYLQSQTLSSHSVINCQDWLQQFHKQT